MVDEKRDEAQDEGGGESPAPSARRRRTWFGARDGTFSYPIHGFNLEISDLPVNSTYRRSHSA
jgi:hypothetical protein